MASDREEVIARRIRRNLGGGRSDEISVDAGAAVSGAALTAVWEQHPPGEEIRRVSFWWPTIGRR
jgi:hypothetical protein